MSQSSTLPRHHHHHVLLLFPLLLTLTATATATFIQTPSGTRLPLQTLRTLLPNTPPHRFRNRLYELTPDNTLLGPNAFHIPLSNQTNLPTTATHPTQQYPPPTITLNGEKWTPPSISPILTRNPQGVHVLTNQAGVILSIWTPTLNLLPLHTRDHPNLFINYEGRPTARPISFLDDMREIPSPSPSPSSVTTSRQSSSSCRNLTPVRVVQLAIAFDHSYCDRFASDAGDATAVVNTLVTLSEKPFSTTSCIRFFVSHIDAHCNAATDPYHRMLSSDTLLDFRDYWIKNRASVKRDVAYLLTGDDDGTSTAGRAYVSAVCNMMFAYGWAEGNSAAVLAHEIGHSLSAQHTSAGLMQPTLSSSIEMKFSQETVNEIISFVDGARTVDCLNGRGGPRPLPSDSPMPTPSPSMVPASPSPSRRPKKSKTPKPTPTPTPSAKKRPKKTKTPSPSPSPKRRRPKKTKTPTPSPSPSPSPKRRRPRKTKTPSPSPSPVASTFPASTPSPMVSPSVSPSASDGTCASGFAPTRLFACSELRTIMDYRSHLGSIRVSMQQAGGEFKVLAAGIADRDGVQRVMIARVKTRISGENVVSSGGDGDDSGWKIVGGGDTMAKKEVVASVKTGEVEAPFQQTTCCGHYLTVGVYVDIVRKIQFGKFVFMADATVNRRFVWGVQCIDPCGGGRGLPLLDRELCPMCSGS